jgi:hypothetical protein
VPDSSAANTHFDVTLVELNRLKANGASSASALGIFVAPYRVCARPKRSSSGGFAKLTEMRRTRVYRRTGSFRLTHDGV